MQGSGARSLPATSLPPATKSCQPSVERVWRSWTTLLAYKKFTQREMFFDNLMKEEFSRVMYYKVTTLREEFFEDHI